MSQRFERIVSSLRRMFKDIGLFVFAQHSKFMFPSGENGPNDIINQCYLPCLISNMLSRVIAMHFAFCV